MPPRLGCSLRSAAVASAAVIITSRLACFASNRAFALLSRPSLPPGLSSQHSSVGAVVSHQGTARHRRRTLRFAREEEARGEEADGGALYPNLVRVESFIYEYCAALTGTHEADCLRNWYMLAKFHKDSATQCMVDDFKCMVLDLLDRLCAGIRGTDDVSQLNWVSSSAKAFRDMYHEDWNRAFEAADADASGVLDFAQFAAAAESVGTRMTRAAARMIFSAADTDEDGMLSRAEFSQFFTVATLAQEPLARLSAGRGPRTQPDLQGRWSTFGRSSPSAGVAGLSRMPR